MIAARRSEALERLSRIHRSQLLTTEADIELDSLIDREGLHAAVSDAAALPIAAKYERAVDLGDNYAWGAAKIYRAQGHYEQMLRVLEKGWRRGDPTSTTELGYLSLTGGEPNSPQLYPQSKYRAIALYSAGAAAGDRDALRNLAVSIADPSSACTFFLQSAYLGNAAAAYNLAQRLEDKRCQFPVPTLKLFQVAADAGEVNAMLRLARVFERGDFGAEQNPTKARALYDQVIRSADATEDQKDVAKEGAARVSEEPPSTP